MKALSSGLIIGVSIGVVIGVLLAICAFFCFRIHSKRSQIGNSSSRHAATVPIRANGADSCTILSDSSFSTTDSPKLSVNSSGMSSWFGGIKKANVVSASGILEYSYKDLQKATCNFTALIGQRAFGPVYKARMSTGEIVAVKMLATDSKQGEKEFHTELGGIMHGEQELTFTLKEKHNRDGFYGSESDEPSTPKKIRRNNAFSSFTNAPMFLSDFRYTYNGGYDKSSGSTSRDEEQHSQCISPGTPPIFNHHNSSRRKAIPHRAPF